MITTPEVLSANEDKILAGRGIVLGFALGTNQDQQLLQLMRRMKECLVPTFCTINMEDPVRAMKTFLDAADIVNEVRLLRIPAQSILSYGLKPYQRLINTIRQMAEKRGVNVLDDSAQADSVGLDNAQPLSK